MFKCTCMDGVLLTLFISLKAMRFGELPGWAIELSNSIREVVFHSDSEHLFEIVDTDACEKVKEIYRFPSELLWREPLFDQLIVNIYQPGEVR